VFFLPAYRITPVHELLVRAIIDSFRANAIYL
jgi:hypothetical protein